MNKIRIVLAVFLLSGCVAVTEQSSVDPKPIDQRRQLTQIEKVKVGMTSSEVESLMGKELKIGYQIPEGKVGSVEMMKVDQPYRVETIAQDGKEYEIRYYLTSIVKADDIVAEDELTAVILLDGVVVGKGEEQLFEIKKQQQVD